ncbi:hypothetical protein N9O57_00590 [bacterium]|nr:hypothetical protein [bacterium]
MKTFILSIFFSFSSSLMACPACVNSMGSEKELYVVYVLGIFILLCWLPMWILWRTILKYRKNQISAH